MRMFNKILAELRKKSGLSQSELARLSKVSPDHIAKIEQGRRKPPKKKNLIKIINALNLSEEDRDKLLSSAGYSSRLREPLVFYAPSSGDDLEMEISEGKDIAGLKNPAIKIVAEILSDAELPIESRKEIEKMIISFAEWLRGEKKKETFNGFEHK
jgi:transcriptional regulator with XRE-family HTH domain